MVFHFILFYFLFINSNIGLIFIYIIKLFKYIIRNYCKKYYYYNNFDPFFIF